MPDTQAAMQFAIVISGDEILSGRRVDKHVSFITSTLNTLGMECVKAIIVGDQFKTMTAAVRSAMDAAPITLVTGGLGPTVDDITRDALSEATNIPLKEDPEALEAISTFFKKIDRAMADNNRRQALIPVTGGFFENPRGTAPGLYFDSQKSLVIALPGPPRELEPMLVEAVIPFLKARFKIVESVSVKHLHFASIGESNVDQVLRSILPHDPNLKISSLSNPGLVDVTLFLAGDLSEGKNKLNRYTELIKAEIGEYLYSVNKQESLVQVIAGMLKARGETLAVAESCTGGLLASKITAYAGSSDYFQGGIISYTNSAKQKLLGVKKETVENHGAVSRETVMEMAQGACQVLGSTWALAISGVAGPSGGTAEKPVGTVWFALSKNGGETYPFKAQLAGDRNTVQLRSYVYALDQLRRVLLDLPIHK